MCSGRPAVKGHFDLQWRSLCLGVRCSKKPNNNIVLLQVEGGLGCGWRGALGLAWWDQVCVCVCVIDVSMYRCGKEPRGSSTTGGANIVRCVCSRVCHCKLTFCLCVCKYILSCHDTSMCCVQTCVLATQMFVCASVWVSVCVTVLMEYSVCVCVCCVCVCVCVHVCVMRDYIIYNFLGFTVYIIIDLGKCSVLTLVGEIWCYRSNSYYYYCYKTNRTFENKILGF